MRLYLLTILLIVSWGAWAQQDSLRSGLNFRPETIQSLDDSVVFRDKKGRAISREEFNRRYNPRKALMYSAVMPGLGQIYNKKYWKLPLIYGGYFVLIRQIGIYQNGYNRFKSELFDYLNANNNGANLQKTAGGFPESQIRNLVDKARRERDFFMIISGVVYLLQIMDAHVDAHLKEFDVNPKLKVSFEPSIQSNPLWGRTQGVAITIKF